MLRAYIVVKSSDPIGPLAFVRTLPRSRPWVSQGWYHVTPPRDLDSVLDDDDRRQLPVRLCGSVQVESSGVFSTNTKESADHQRCHSHPVSSAQLDLSSAYLSPGRPRPCNTMPDPSLPSPPKLALTHHPEV
jgi:hypothetical protein